MVYIIRLTVCGSISWKEHQQPVIWWLWFRLTGHSTTYQVWPSNQRHSASGTLTTRAFPTRGPAHIVIGGVAVSHELTARWARNKKQTGSKFTKIRRSAICNMNFFALEWCSRWLSGGCHSQKGPLEVKSACSLGADLIITPAGCALMPGSPPNAIGHRMLVFGPGTLQPTR